MFEQYRASADPKVCCDYTLHVSIPEFNESVAREMEVLVNEKGVNSFIVLDELNQVSPSDNESFNAFRRCRDLGAVAIAHGENGKLVKLLQNSVFDSGVTGPEGHLYSHPEAVSCFFSMYLFLL